MNRELLLGDEAVAMGAIHAGIGGAFSYPGTPATEIFDTVDRYVRAGSTLTSQAVMPAIAARWSVNEKIAYEGALGMSYIGKRALVSMKHVGLNVAADPFMSSALTGANGGIVLAVGDDPGMHSSQNEQDTRYYAMFARLPLFEPASPQEAYDMTREAFDLSERFTLPIVMRLVTRLAHGRSNVILRPPTPPPPRPRAGDWHEWALLPPNARKRYQRVLDLQPELLGWANTSCFNRLELRGPRGIITTGLAGAYFQEAAGESHDYSVLHIGAYPIPRDLVRRITEHCRDVLVIEEGSPLVERLLVGLLGLRDNSVRGKLTGALPAQGELTVDLVRGSLGPSNAPTKSLTLPVNNPDPPVPARPPRLCGGCPHCDTYKAIVDAVGAGNEHYYFSDIGCYTLAALPPYNAVDTCVDMGASIGMAIGAARGGAHPVVATIGDSTFLHSGLGALVEAVHDDLNMTIVILDNALVAMTGGQECYATGDDLARVVLGLGVNEHHLVRIEPLARNHDEQVEIIRNEIGHRGLSVVIACRPCIHAKRRAAEANPRTGETDKRTLVRASATDSDA